MDFNRARWAAPASGHASFLRLLDLERGKEALHHCVVVAVPKPTHAQGAPVGPRERPVGPTGVLPDSAGRRNTTSWTCRMNRPSVSAGVRQRRVPARRADSARIYTTILLAEHEALTGDVNLLKLRRVLKNLCHAGSVHPQRFGCEIGKDEWVLPPRSAARPRCSYREKRYSSPWLRIHRASRSSLLERRI